MATVTHKLKPLYDGMRVTREQYLDLPDDGFQYDMIDGVLHMSPSAFFDHNDVIFNFIVTLGNYLKEHAVAKAVPETDIFLPDGGDVLRPDISVILNENMGIIVGHIHGVPDMVVEVLSDSTRKRDLGNKAERYLANGVKEYWILDPTDKSLHLWLNRGDLWEKKSGDILSSELLAGLQITANEVFSELV